MIINALTLTTKDYAYELDELYPKANLASDPDYKKLLVCLDRQSLGAAADTNLASDLGFDYDTKSVLKDDFTLYRHMVGDLFGIGLADIWYYTLAQGTMDTDTKQATNDILATVQDMVYLRLPNVDKAYDAIAEADKDRFKRAMGGYALATYIKVSHYLTGTEVKQWQADYKSQANLYLTNLGFDAVFL